MVHLRLRARLATVAAAAIFSAAWCPPVDAAAAATSQSDGDAGDAGTRERKDDEAARRALEMAPARRKIGRLRGLRFVSRVTFVTAPETPHELTMSLAFPARSRLTLVSEGGSIRRFQLGQAWFGRNLVDGSSPADRRSFLLAGQELDETQLDMALRRALFLWPDGARFSGAGTTRTCQVEGLGVLLAIVDPKIGRPSSISAFGPDGRAASELRDVRWTTGEGRAWPQSMVFAAGGQPLWNEVVERVEDEWLFADTWFLPADLVAGIVGRPIDTALRMRVVEAAWRKRSELPAGTTRVQAVGLALERWEAARDRLRERGLAIGPSVEIELDGRRAPVAVSVEVFTGVRSDAALGDAKGWSKHGRAMAWTYLCKSPGEVTKSAFETVVEAAAASGSVLGNPLLRFDVVEGGKPGAQAPRASRLRVVQGIRGAEPDAVDVPR